MSCGGCGAASRANGGQQRTAGDDQVGQSAEAVELGGVLGESAVAGLAVSEEVLDDVKGMFHPRAHLGFELLNLLGEFFDRSLGHGFDLAALGGHMPFDARAASGDLLPFLHPKVTRVGIACLLLPVQ